MAVGETEVTMKITFSPHNNHPKLLCWGHVEIPMSEITTFFPNQTGKLTPSCKRKEMFSNRFHQDKARIHCRLSLQANKVQARILVRSGFFSDFLLFNSPKEEILRVGLGFKPMFRSVDKKCLCVSTDTDKTVLFGDRIMSSLSSPSIDCSQVRSEHRGCRSSSKQIDFYLHVPACTILQHIGTCQLNLQPRQIIKQLGYEPCKVASSANRAHKEDMNQELKGLPFLSV